MAKTSPKFLAKAGPAWPRPPWTASPRPRHPTGNKSCCGNFKSRINVWSCSFKPFTEHGCPVYKEPCSDLLCQNNVQKKTKQRLSLIKAEELQKWKTWRHTKFWKKWRHQTYTAVAGSDGFKSVLKQKFNGSCKHLPCGFLALRVFPVLWHVCLLLWMR